MFAGAGCAPNDLMGNTRRKTPVAPTLVRNDRRVS
jgi:hypothetical protein